jgi:AraC-like DNA-binding protein
MDPLSQVFSFLNVRASRCTRFEASGHWSFRFPAKPALKFGAILRGACWIDFGTGERHHLVAGDSFLIADGPSYVLANDESAFPADGIAMFDWEHSDVARHVGADTILVAGSFTFDISDADLLLEALPRFLLIPAQHPSASIIRSTLHIISEELRSMQIGAAMLAERLVDILLVQVLRAALDQDGNKDFGWIGALTDSRMSKTIQMMHGDVAHPWSIEELSGLVAMSRSAFSKRFKALVGRAPLDYLLRWRMRVARNMLRQGDSVAVVARDVGYASESAFRHAFKRLYGHAPRRYWQEMGE